MEHIYDSPQPVHNTICLPDYQGEQVDPQVVSSQAAYQGCTAGVEQEFPHDGGFPISQCLQHPDLGALFLHHAVHGSHTYQGCHQEEEYWKHIGNPVHNAGIILKEDITDIGVPAKDIGIWLFQVCNLLACIGNFLLGIGDLLLEFLITVTVFLPAVLQISSAFFQVLLPLFQFAPAILQFFPALLQIPPALRQVLLSLFQFLPGIGNLLLPPGNLLPGTGNLIVCCQ